MINKIQVDVYLEAPWEYDAEDEDICVLHTLVISPRVFGKGLGTRFVRFYEEYAKKHGCSELRLDTNERNKAGQCMLNWDTKRSPQCLLHLMESRELIWCFWKKRYHSHTPAAKRKAEGLNGR